MVIVLREQSPIMQKLVFFFAAGMVFAFGGRLDATIYSGSTTLAALVSNSSNGIIVGDKLFDHFTYVTTPAGNNMPPASGVNVIPIINNPAYVDQIGIRFQANFHDNPGAPPYSQADIA